MDTDPTGTEPAPAAATEIRMGEDAAALLAKVLAERDEAVEARKRALADFVNFQRRAAENEQRAVRQGVVQVARNLLPALDQFDLSLLQAPATLTVEQLLKGIEMTRDELVRTLERSGIEVDKDAVVERAAVGHRWRNPIWRHADGSFAEW